MSSPEQSTVDCPHCGHTRPITIWRTVNVTIDPGMRQCVLDRTLHEVTCHECREKFRFASNLLYHDMVRKFIVSLVHSEKDAPFEVQQSFLNGLGSAMAQYRLRFVTSYNQLVEKIRIFEAGLSDFVIEALKLVAWYNVLPEKPIGDDNMYFCTVNGVGSPEAVLVFEGFDGGKYLGTVELPFTAYSAGSSTKFGTSTYRLGEWLLVNQSNFGRF